MHARIRDAVHGHRARGERAAEMPHDWDAHWRPVGAEIYVTSCDLGIFRGSAHRADLAPGCRLVGQFPDGQGGLADSGSATVRMGGGGGSISLLSLAGR